MLVVLQKMVKEDGQVSPEFADADEGDIQFSPIVSFWPIHVKSFQCLRKCLVSLIPFSFFICRKTV